MIYNIDKSEAMNVRRWMNKEKVKATVTNEERSKLNNPLRTTASCSHPCNEHMDEVVAGGLVHWLVDSVAGSTQLVSRLFIKKFIVKKGTEENLWDEPCPISGSENNGKPLQMKKFVFPLSVTSSSLCSSSSNTRHTANRHRIPVFLNFDFWTKEFSDIFYLKHYSRKLNAKFNESPLRYGGVN
ncbi:hypothetical protein CBL_12365 [Carabus blaptoides fortunei]